MTIDLLPTIAQLTGADLPPNRLDGKNIWKLISRKKGANSPQEAYYFYWGEDLHAVRKGKWSLHLPHAYRSLKGEPGSGGIPGPYVQKKTGLALFDLSQDIGQQRDIAADHPDVVAELQALAKAHVQYVKDEAREPQRH